VGDVVADADDGLVTPCRHCWKLWFDTKPRLRLMIAVFAQAIGDQPPRNKLELLLGQSFLNGGIDGSHAD